MSLASLRKLAVRVDELERAVEAAARRYRVTPGPAGYREIAAAVEALTGKRSRGGDTRTTFFRVTER